MFSAAVVPQLVPAVVSLRVRDFPVVSSLMFAQALDTQFARDVRAGLTQPEQKTLPCRYLYDKSAPRYSKPSHSCPSTA